MENASKALIIAGAILIAIVLITLGVVLLQQGQGVADSGETALTAREIETFNSQFTRYEGTNVSGSNVRQLISSVNASNAAQTNGGENHQVSLKKKTGTGSATTLSKASDVKNGEMYTIDCTYGTSGKDKGFVTEITVTGTFN
ncbi:MAG: hypothetical protein IJH76_03590 [Clostridia bacterium]|nr:hypothetical protein [Clostridia bacterium]